MNLSEAFAESARARPDRPAVEDGRRVVSYGELEGLAGRAAAALRDAGVAPGDVVALLLPDSVEHVAAVWALSHLGAVIFPLNVRVLRAAQARGLGDLPLKFAVVTDAHATMPAGTKAIPLATLFDDRRDAPPAAPLGPGGSAPLACVQSSGTTGAPKSFLLSHDQLAGSYQCNLDLLRWTPEDRMMPMVRFGFFAGCRHIFAALSMGATLVINRARSIDGLIREIQQKRITTTVLTPLHLRNFLRHARDDGPLFPLIRSIRVATGAITLQERTRARERITPNLIVVYGCNELSWVSIATPEDQDAFPDSVGRPLEGVTVQVVDEAGQPLPAGEVGLIRFKADWAATGYLDNPAATARAFRDGWLYPMDLAAMNAEGYIFLKGRADDLMSVDGIKFYPIEVEAVLKAHPRVTDAAVFGWPHPRHGEVPVAAVTADGSVSDRSLQALCKKNLASYKIPRRFFVLPALPRNAMGKIVKSELKQVLAGDLARRSQPRQR